MRQMKYYKTKIRVKWEKDLSSVLDTNVGDPEGVHSPIQVVGLLGLPKRQPFSQRSLVNLNDIDTSFLKILHFILDGQSNLVGSLGPGLVISNKGPVEDGNRACKHSLHWAGSHALSS